MLKRTVRIVALVGVVGALMAPAVPAGAHARSHSHNGCSATSGHQTSPSIGVWISSHNCQQTRARLTYWSDGMQQTHTVPWTSGNAAAILSTGSYISGHVVLANAGTQSGWLSH